MASTTGPGPGDDADRPLQIPQRPRLFDASPTPSGMATYAIGDIQGCHEGLLRLLTAIRFSPGRDRLWFAGDLVNRGPDSLAVLQLVRQLGEHAVTVLGNHDLHLLAVACGARRRGRHDTLDGLLESPQREALLDWLRHQPLLHESTEHGLALLHAGLPPQWTMAQARDCANEVHTALAGPDWQGLLAAMYGDEPAQWSPALSGIERLRFTINCYTRLRYCDAQGRLQLRDKGAPGSQDGTLLPWFAVPGRASRSTELLFGHWSTLGQVHWPEHGVYGLDTGCVWGGQLTALRLEDRSLHSVACPQTLAPGGD